MQELLRHKKVLNMMISMHSMLRDSYKRKALTLDLIIFISSALIISLVFVDFRFFSRFDISPENAHFYVGIFSLIIFFLSILTLLVNWKSISESHNKASLQLSKLLTECRQLLDMEDNKEKIALLNSYNIKYAEINESIIKIPERKFIALKSKHLKKIELSRLLDTNPSKPLFLLRLILLLRK